LKIVKPENLQKKLCRYAVTSAANAKLCKARKQKKAMVLRVLLYTTQLSTETGPFLPFLAFLIYESITQPAAADCEQNVSQINDSIVFNQKNSKF
jgi:hypothetical protein